MPDRASINSQFLYVTAPAGLLCVLLAGYFAFIYALSLNIPYFDELVEVLEFVVSFVQLDGAQDRLELWLTSFNNHRTSASRLLYLGAYYLEGNLNFRTLVLVANLALPGVLLLLFRSLAGHRFRWWIILAVALVLLQLTSFVMMFWAMTAISFFYVALYGFAAIWALHQPTPSRMLLAVCCATLASFTLSSGVLVWGLGAASLLHQRFFVRKVAGAYMVAWFGAAAVCLSLFVLLPHPETAGTLSPAPGATSFGLALENGASLPGLLWHNIQFFFVLLGSAVGVVAVPLAGALGLLVFLAAVVFTLRNYRQADQRLLLFWWYAIGSAAAITLGRGSIASLEYVLTSRYAFMGVLVFALAIAYIGSRLATRQAGPLGAMVGICLLLFTVSWYAHLGPLQGSLNRRVGHFNVFSYPLWGFDQQDSNTLVKRAVDAGVYIPPARPLPKIELLRAAGAGPGG